MITFKIKFSQNNNCIPIKMFDTNQQIETQFGVVQTVADVNSIEKYTGNYIVVPDIDEEQKLSTKGKLLTENVTVKKIPVWTFENNSGGNTVVIGGEF